MSQVAARDLPRSQSTVDSAIAGDELAFARLIADHHPAMIRVAYVITGNMDSAADAVQTAWGIAWRRMGSLRDRSQIRSWLVAIAANEARQVRRRVRRSNVVDISAALDHRIGLDPSDVIPVVDLRQALSQLDADDQILLALRFVGHLDSNEIATHLRLTPSGVRSRLARLLDRLRFDLRLGEGESR
jgi:RNA polymerase sigma-70 factor (ECF subfamily)